MATVGSLALALVGAAMPALAADRQSAPAAPPAAETYTLTGYEVWFSPTVGSFVGTGRGDTGELAAWQAAIEHSVVISPAGSVTGGWATLYRTDGVQIGGRFSDGTVTLVNEGANCTAETHVVHGTMADVWRSDRGFVGSGLFDATLVHHRLWIFGRCISYSASVTATITILDR